MFSLKYLIHAMFAISISSAVGTPQGVLIFFKFFMKQFAEGVILSTLFSKE